MTPNSNNVSKLVRIHLVPAIGLLIAASAMLVSCGSDAPPPVIPQPQIQTLPNNNPYLPSNSWGTWGYIVNGQLCFKNSDGSVNSAMACTTNFQHQGTYATYTGPNGQPTVVSLLGPTYPWGQNYGNQNYMYGAYNWGSPYNYGYGYYPWYNGGSYWVNNVPYSNCGTFNFNGYIYGYLVL